MTTLTLMRIERRIGELYGTADDLEADGSYDAAGRMRDKADAMVEEIESARLEEEVIFDAEDGVVG